MSQNRLLDLVNANQMRTDQTSILKLHAVTRKKHKMFKREREREIGDTLEREREPGETREVMKKEK